MRQSTWKHPRSWAAWVADHEIYPLVVGVALATFSARWAPWGLGLLAALWLVRRAGGGRLTARTPLEWSAGLLLLMIPVTFYATTDRQVTFIQVSRLLAGLALTYGLVNWARRGAHVTLLILGLGGLGLALAVVSPVTVGWFSQVKLFLIPSRVYQALPTLVSDPIHPNMMAGALVLLLPFPLTLLLIRGSLPPAISATQAFAARLLNARWFRHLWGAAALLSMLVVLVLTKSRGGWIAGVVVVFAVLARRWRRLLWLIPLAPVGVGALLWRAGPSAVLDWIGSGDAISGWDGRLEIWSRALYMIQDFPFTGIGVGTFNSVANALYPFFLAGPDAEIPHAHNLLLQVAVDLGIPGLVAFLAILLAALWSALESARFYRREGQTALAAVAWAALASLIGMLVHGLVDATTWLVGRGAFVPWAVIGTIIALERRPELPTRDEEADKGLEGVRGAQLWWVGLLIVVLVAVGLLGWYMLRDSPSLGDGDRPSIRAPLYPEAQGVDVRTEDAPPDAGWTGPLEVATFTTTHPISDVVAFYTNALAAGGWRASIEAGDATSWGGIYTREGGHAVCMLNAFVIETDVWISVVCGDKAEPVDLPALTPLPTPTIGVVPDD